MAEANSARVSTSITAPLSDTVAAFRFDPPGPAHGGPDNRGMSAQHSPAAERNGPYILAQLRRLLPERGLLLEIASGTGQHAACCSAGLPGWQWQPSDRNPGGFASIQAWCAGLPRARPPVVVDVLQASWPDAAPSVDAIFCANMIHIAPWACTAGLMQGAARHLSSEGVLVTYGPYLEDSVPTAPGNLAFDINLRADNPEWGIRHLKDVATAAGHAGLVLRERVAMPANNLLLVWGRRTGLKAAAASSRSP